MRNILLRRYFRFVALEVPLEQFENCKLVVRGLVHFEMEQLGNTVVASEKGEPVLELQAEARKPVVELGDQVVEQQKKVQELQAASRKNTQARYLQAPMDRTRSRCQNRTFYKLIQLSVFLCK